jgi:hypothetical protein
LKEEERVMRLHKLVPALMAAASLLALTPAGAQARKHASPTGRCRVSINVAPRRITAGDPVVVFGRLLCSGNASAANQPVKLFHNLRGVGGGFTYIQSATTDANGFYEFARADGVVVSNRAWLVRSHGAQSARKAVKVAAQVTLSGPAEGSQLYTGPANKVTFTGTVNPADVGASVILQRQNAATGSDDWRRIDAGTVSAGGSYSIVHRFIVPGDANIRVLVRSRRRNVPSPSNVLEYEITQAQNPNLTIAASADPIGFGQSVTISGTLSGGASRPVTLLARTRTQSFAPVAQATTDASGNYSFPAQVPVNSTFYKVTGAGRTSAVLYEGVKDALTAQASATTIQAGGSVTFSGVVSPDHSGHVIYLERQNSIGQGFHVIEVATVGAGSVYALEHKFFDAGTKSVRVFIPGGPENQGVASQTFTIQVSAGAASTLTPEAPSNSTAPAEGQS